MNNRPIILLVDDNPDNLHMLYQALKDEYDLRSVTSGLDALKLAGELYPDLILLDIMMPGMDGYETCRKLKTTENIRGIPVIFVTALHDDLDEARGFEAGGVDFIIKPIKPLLLRKRVAAHIALKLRTDQLELRNKELEEANSKIKVLTGLVPICMSCKKIRDDNGYWNQLESYISQHSDALFSHGYCPDCAKIAEEELNKL